MKTTTKFISILIFATIILASCKKDKTQQEPAFDINKLEGYYLFSKWKEDKNPNLIKFEADNMFLKYHSSYSGGVRRSYTVKSNNEIFVDDADEKYSVFIENGKVTSHSSTKYSDFTLIKAPATNQLAGKTFTGTYFRRDGSVLHQNFFYSFDGSESKLSAGFNVGTSTRTDIYNLIGNFAARNKASGAGTDDYEFMVLVDGKLEVGYSPTIGATGSIRHYGTFVQQ